MKNLYYVLIIAAIGTLCASDKSESYVLGPGDSISVQVDGLPEFGNTPHRIDADGTVGLPLLGRVRAEGLTLARFEASIATSLKSQVLDPRVVASVTQFRNEPVSVIGAVNNPGTQDLTGPKTLFDVLAAAGGPKQDAGETVTITRQMREGQLQLPNATADPATGRTTAVVSLRDLVDLRSPAANIAVRPYDQIAVPRASVVYVIGNVRKAGGFTLTQGRSMSALEALSLAEGLSPNASPKSARILRKQGGTRVQIPVNLKKILDGKSKDVQLAADDILFVPDNLSRKITTKTLEVAMNTISGVVIWRGL
jgi:polysaccharide biosynthesis/export protein